MSAKQITFKEGASLNRPPLFEGEHFSFWQARMQIFIQSTDPGAWIAVQNGPHIPVKMVDGKEVPQQWDEMSAADKVKVQYDLKAKNIITSGLSSDEFFRTVRCRSAKEMWEMLEVTHEGTEEVRRARKHALVHEYEMVKMKPEETIAQFQTRFTHIVNHLLGLGKTFDDDELNVKVLKSLSNVWLPKVTAIREAKDLSKMSLAALFGKLLEYETDAANHFDLLDESNKKHRNIALKAIKSKKTKSEASSSNEEEEENMNLIVRRFRRFLSKKNPRREVKAEKKDDPPTGRNIICFECGKKGHFKTDCAVYLKKQLMEQRSKAEKKEKNYIAWE